MPKDATPSTVASNSLPKTKGFSGKHFWWTFVAIPMIAITYLVYPTSKTSSKLHCNGREERGIAEMYDQDDLSACSLFAGNFINFGFWEYPLKGQQISISQRVESEKNLYRFVAKKLGIKASDTVLEVACGQGVGSALVFSEFNAWEIHGIDFSKAQILRAKKINSEATEASNNKLFFDKALLKKSPINPTFSKKCFP